VNESTDAPRGADEWRVEVALDEEQKGQSLGERLHQLQLDDEARKRLGGSVVVTRDGDFLFLYGWHEESAREAERVVRELMEEDKLSGEVSLTRWHPVAEEWRPAEEPLPESDAARAAEELADEAEGRREEHESGEYPWEVLVDLPDRVSTLRFAAKLRREGLPVKRRWSYLLVGTDTEDDAVELGKQIEAEVPEGARVGVRGNPSDMPVPSFIMLGSLKPGFLRDLGL
jgi:hypothetical protein